jgi:hypothetical protein
MYATLLAWLANKGVTTDWPDYSKAVNRGRTLSERNYKFYAAPAMAYTSLLRHDTNKFTHNLSVKNNDKGGAPSASPDVSGSLLPLRREGVGGGDKSLLEDVKDTSLDHVISKVRFYVR